MKRIAIDIDGVLADYNGAMWRLLQAQGAPMEAFAGEDPDCWDWYEPYGATPDHVGQALRRQTPEWWGQLDTHRDLTLEACNGIAQLCLLHEVTFVTSRPCGRDAAWRWLDWYLGEDVHPHVLVTPGDKVAALVAMEVDAVVEDRVGTLTRLARLGWPAMLVLVNRAYNVGPPNTRIHRVPTTCAAITYLLETL